MREPILQPLFQAADGFRLVSGGAKGGMQNKRLLINQNLKKN